MSAHPHHRRLDEIDPEIDPELDLEPGWRRRRARLADDVGRLLQVARAEAEWSQTVDALRAGVVMTDLEGRVVRCNAAFERAVGVPRAELVGAPLASAIGHPAGLEPPGLGSEEHPGAAAADLELCALGGRFAVRRSPLQRGGSLVAWTYVFEALPSAPAERAARTRLAAALELAAAGAAVLDSEGRLEHTTSALRRALGAAAAEWIPGAVVRSTGPLAHLAAAIDAARATGAEARCHVGTGSGAAALRVAPLRAPGDPDAATGFAVVMCASVGAAAPTGEPA